MTLFPRPREQGAREHSVARARRFSILAARPRQNLLDHRSLGVGVVLRILPGAAGKVPFGALVELAIGDIAAQPVAEEQHAVNLWPTFRTTA
jgi:hypothetical protein